MIGLKEVVDARTSICSKIRRTPCAEVDFGVDYRLFLKLENLQRTNAFKIRGNLNKILRLPEEEKRRGVITASTGNHGQGLALAASLSGSAATVVVPRCAPRNKVRAILRHGARVIESGDDYQAAFVEARRIGAEESLTYVHSFDDCDIIAGQGTIGLEILEDVPDVDCVVAPIGGGGLLSGLLVSLKESRRDIKVVGVEARNAAKMHYSMERGRVSEIGEARTMADGLAVRRPGDLTYEVVSRYVDVVVTVEESEIERAVFDLLVQGKVLAEGAGAASVAALGQLRGGLAGRKVVCVITGGNIDVPLVSALLQKYGAEPRGMPQDGVERRCN